MNYYIMSTEFDAFNNENVAQYDDNKLVLSNVYPNGFDGETVDLTGKTTEAGEPWTMEHYLPIIEELREAAPTGRLVIIPKWVGRALYKTHPAFMPDYDTDGVN